MAKDQQGLTLAGSPSRPQGVRSRDRRLLRADRRSGRDSQAGARARSRFRARRRRDRGALHDRRLSRRPSGGGRARSARPKRRSRGASERERRHLAAARAWAGGRTSEATWRWETILVDHPTDALALRLGAGRLFLSRPVAGASAIAPRACCRRGIATIRSRASSSAFTPSGSRRRANSSAPRISAARRWPRNPRDAWAAHALAHVMETANRQDEGRRLSQVDAAGLEPRAFHGRPQRLASRALSDRAGAVRRGPRRLRPLRRAQARRRRDARPRRRRCRSCGGSSSRASTSANRWAPVARPVDGACRRPRARFQRSALRFRRGALAATRATSSACAVRSTTTSATALGDNRQVTAEVGRRAHRRRARFRRRRLCAGGRSDPAGSPRGGSHRRQPRPARHRQLDADRRGRAIGPMAPGAGAARRARRRPADRAHACRARAGARPRRDGPTESAARRAAGTPISYRR